MYYGERTSAEIQQLAAYEEQAFRLPPEWKQDRYSTEGYAIDSPQTRLVDDTVNLMGDIVHVNIADVGTYLPAYPALSRLAIDSLNGPALANGAPRPMLPRRIGQGILSLADGEERPSMITQVGVEPDGSTRAYEPVPGIIRAKRLNFTEADRAIANAQTEEGIALNGIHAAALRMFRARHAAGASDPAPASPSKLIVQESMIGGGGSMAEFAFHNKINIIYRTHAFQRTGMRLPKEFEHLGSDVLSSVNPREHEALGKALYANVTSPLWRVRDYVSVANIAAFIRGERPPFTKDDLRSVADRDNREAHAVRSINRRRGGERRRNSRW